MSFQEKRAIASLISTVVSFVIYYLIVFQMYLEGGYSLTEEISFWGAVLLIQIPVQIIFKIIVHIIFVIITKITTNECEPEITDELDRLIELKATNNYAIVFFIGFIFSLVSLVLGFSITVMFNLQLFSMFIGACTWDISQLYFYRRGV